MRLTWRRTKTWGYLHTHTHTGTPAWPLDYDYLVKSFSVLLFLLSSLCILFQSAAQHKTRRPSALPLTLTLPGTGAVCRPRDYNAGKAGRSRGGKRVAGLRRRLASSLRVLDFIQMTRDLLFYNKHMCVRVCAGVCMLRECVACVAVCVCVSINV